jgi:23S rRNA (guanosine2251-2'-O)-methyltransferase
MRRHKFSPHATVALASPPRRGGVLCGINAICEALRSDVHRIDTIWLAESKEGKRLQQVMALAAQREIPIKMVPTPRLTRVAGTTAHQGIVAFVASAAVLSLDQLTTQVMALRHIPPLVVLDGVKDPRNLGAIIRSAAAFGVGGVIVPQRRAAGLTGTVAKTAAGGIEHVAVAEVINISQTLERLKQVGFWVVGTDERADMSCRTFAFPRLLTLVLGEEESGISPLVKRHCDALVSVPVWGQFRSLNVAVAAAVLFYEVMGREPRQDGASQNNTLPTSISDGLSR